MQQLYKGTFKKKIFIPKEEKSMPSKIIIYGHAGAGKTHMLHLIHEGLKKLGTKGLYIMDFDGTRTLHKLKHDGDVELFVDTKKTKGESFERWMYRINEFEKDHEGYGGFAIDSLTTMQHMMMNYVHKINKVARHLDFLSNMQDYGVLVDLLEQMMPQFTHISSKALLILTAHIRSFEDTTEGGKTYCTPSVRGRVLPSSLGLYFNEVWRLDKSGTGAGLKRRVQTDKDYKYIAKTQTEGIKMPFDTIEHCIECVLKAFEKGGGELGIKIEN